MPRYTRLIPFSEGQEWKKQTLHFNQKEWDTVLELAKELGYDDLSSVVKESMKLALLHLKFRKLKIADIKSDIALFDLKEHNLFNVI